MHMEAPAHVQENTYIVHASGSSARAPLPILSYDCEQAVVRKLAFHDEWRHCSSIGRYPSDAYQLKMTVMATSNRPTRSYSVD